MLGRIIEKFKGSVAEVRSDTPPIRARVENGVIVISGQIENPDNLYVLRFDSSTEISFESESEYRKLESNERVIAKADFFGFENMLTGHTANGEYFKAVGGAVHSKPLTEFNYRIENKN